MYYRQALELQAFLDMAKDEGAYENYCCSSRHFEEWNFS